MVRVGVVRVGGGGIRRYGWLGQGSREWWSQGVGVVGSGVFRWGF